MNELNQMVSLAVGSPATLGVAAILTAVLMSLVPVLLGAVLIHYEVQEAAQKQRQQLVRQTSLADIQQQVVGAEQGVSIAKLQAKAQIQQATGEAEGVRLRAHGEAEAIRATGQAKAEAYRVGVDSLGAQGYAFLQLMQIVGERNVRIVPDVAVSGANANPGMVDGLLGVMLRSQTNGSGAKAA